MQGEAQWPFNQPFHFILSMQIGGIWVNGAGPTNPAHYPAAMAITGSASTAAGSQPHPGPSLALSPLSTARREAALETAKAKATLPRGRIVPSPERSPTRPGTFMKRPISRFPEFLAP